MPDEKQVFFGQKISAKLIDLIDGSRGGRSRSQWAREAFVEKLIRERPEQAAALLSLINPPDRAGVGGRPTHRKNVIGSNTQPPPQMTDQDGEILPKIERGIIEGKS